MEKWGTSREHLQRSNKKLRFCIGPNTILIQPSSNLGTGRKSQQQTLQEYCNVYSKPETLRATKKSLASTPKKLDCETPANSEQLVFPPSTPTVSTPNAVNKNAQ